MRMKSLWLFLAVPLGSSLAYFLEHDVHDMQGKLDTGAEVSEADLYVPEGQQPLLEESHHPHNEDLSVSIYQRLADDNRFSLVTKAINFVDDVASLLNDTSSHLTFFAPPDRVLRRRPGSQPKKDLSFFALNNIAETLESDESAIVAELNDLGRVIELINELEFVDVQEGPDGEKRKKIIKIILRAILNYHIIPAAYDITSLGNNITYPTNLNVSGALDNEPLRLRITQTVLPPATSINFFSKIFHPNLKATNGIIHVIDHPLIPPPSVFQQLYIVPHFFSTLTSALQRSDLTQAVDLRFVRGEGLKGASAVTVFAPTNRAFEALPKKLQLFLFSPFGEKALKKLLQYHIIPNAVVHSNYIHGEVVKPTELQAFQSPTEVEDSEFQLSPWAKKPKHEPHHSNGPTKVEHISRLNLTLDTLFEGHALNALIVQKRHSFPKLPGHKQPYVVDTRIFVNHHLAVVSDVVALNGAIHVVDKLLDPRKPHRRGPHHGHGRPHHEVGGEHSRTHQGPPHPGPEHEDPRPDHRGPLPPPPPPPRPEHDPGHHGPQRDHKHSSEDHPKSGHHDTHDLPLDGGELRNPQRHHKHPEDNHPRLDHHDSPPRHDGAEHGPDHRGSWRDPKHLEVNRADFENAPPPPAHDDIPHGRNQPTPKRDRKHAAEEKHPSHGSHDGPSPSPPHEGPEHTPHHGVPKRDRKHSEKGPDRGPKNPWENRLDRGRHDGPPPPHHDPANGPDDGHRGKSGHFDDSRPSHRKPDHGPENGLLQSSEWSKLHHVHGDLHHLNIQDNDEYDSWADWENWLPQWAEELN